MLECLVSQSFPGSDELRRQLDSIRVAEEYTPPDPSVIFCVDKDAAPSATVERRIPVEGEAPDEDGIPVHVLLHVLNGFLWELEVYRPDGEPVRYLPEPSSLSLLY